MERRYLFSESSTFTKVPNDVMVMDYKVGASNSAMNFITDLRDAEQKIGIKMGEGIEVTTHIDTSLFT